jgi:hypothetical protein
LGYGDRGESTIMTSWPMSITTAAVLVALLLSVPIAVSI